MIQQAVQHEISGYKSQLNDFLASKFIDQSLILGFTTVVQSKFHKWILEDVEGFHQLFMEANDLKQVDNSQCNLIELLKVLWTDFHHPIIKLYQKQHVELFNLLLRPLKPGKKNNFKVVEMRKLSEMFNKYVKAVKAFYTSVMADLGTKYANPLVPQKYLQEFDIVIPLVKEEALYTDFHSTLSYITFMCLVGLGNLTRNWALVRISYVQPCISASAHHKHAQQVKMDKSEGKSHYIYPLLCYSKCVGLLPTMHEPYNHIGVIYNSLGQKFSAILWFLRSQFTRDLTFAVGKRNLVSAFTRPWLEEAYEQAVRKNRQNLEPSDANIILLRIIADYFYRSAYRKTLYTEKAESDFLEVVFSEPYHERFVKCSNVVAEHLTVLICFYELAVQAQETITLQKFGGFLAKYITAYLTTLKTLSFLTTNAETPLKNIRLILAFVRKNQIFFKTCGSKFVSSLVDAFNALVAFDGEETKGRIIDSFVEGKAPIRSHYFSEDINFKDFTPIGCHFKDFEDTHLFESGNVHLLFGSYFYENDQGIPEFLDNEAVVRINKEVELGDKFSREKAIAAECSRSENILRLQASVVLAKGIFGTRIHLDSEKEKFEVEILNVPKTQKRASEKAPRKKNKAKQLAPKKAHEKSEPEKVFEPRLLLRKEPASPTVQIPGTLPSSMEEIGLLIIGHAPKLVSRGHELDREAGLADMVLAIVSEDETRESLTTAGDGLQDGSNDGISKTTESSRVDSAQFMEHGQFAYPQAAQLLQHGSQRLAPLDESTQGASFSGTGYHNSPKYPVSQEPPMTQNSFLLPQQQYSQYFMGFNGAQAPHGAPYGANVHPPNGFPSGPIPQQNSSFYPGMPQFYSPQAMGPVQGNNYGMFPPPHMMPQYPPNMGTQNNGYGMPYGQSGSGVYPQYSSQ